MLNIECGIMNNEVGIVFSVSLSLVRNPSVILEIRIQSESFL